MLRDTKFQALPARAHKAYNYLASQYTGNNNGDLQMAWSIAKGKGWTSNSSLAAALRELIEAGFVMRTRQGWKNRCSLYALTCFPIHNCKGKHDEKPTNTAPALWLKPGNLCGPPAVQREPPAVQSLQISTTNATH
jgi:hypothetical protein